MPALFEEFVTALDYESFSSTRGGIHEGLAAGTAMTAPGPQPAKIFMQLPELEVLLKETASQVLGFTGAPHEVHSLPKN